MIFSEMLCKALDITPEQGDLEGDCCICKKHTENGFKKKFSGNFTCADYISNGDVICPNCYYLVKNSNEYRRTMFLLTEKELIKFKKKEAKEIVLNLLNKPFYFNDGIECVGVGDEVSTTTSTFDYDNVAGTFSSDLNAYADVDVEFTHSDYSEYDSRTCRDGGNYGYDYYVVTKIHEVGEL